MPTVPRRLVLLCGSAIAAGTVLFGCSSQVVVESKFPTPLVQPLPVRMGVIYSKELHNYIYTEALPQQPVWTIDLGDANLEMMRPLFSKMFTETREVAAVPTSPADGTLDGVLEPSVAKFEFDVPASGEKNKFVEVWIQYDLTLYEPNGDKVVVWPVSGYGKSELGRNREDAVQRAAIVAMREVGATISTKFADQPQVSTWLGEKRNASTVSVERPPAQADAASVND